METTVLSRLGHNGRLVIPSEIRKQLKLKDGDPLEIKVEDGRIVIVTSLGLLDEFYSLTRNIHSSPNDPVQDLIDERRHEANHE